MNNLIKFIHSFITKCVKQFDCFQIFLCSVYFWEHMCINMICNCRVELYMINKCVKICPCPSNNLLKNSLSIHFSDTIALLQKSCTLPQISFSWFNVLEFHIILTIIRVRIIDNRVWYRYFSKIGNFLCEPPSV